MLAVLKLLNILDKTLRAKNASPAESTLKILALKVGASRPDTLMEVLNLLDEVRDEIEICNFRNEERKVEYLSILESRKSEFLLSLSSEKSELYKWVEQTSRWLEVVAEAVTERLDSTVSDLDRTEFVAETQKLMDAVQQWSIDEYARRSLLLALSMTMQKATVEGSANSDAEVRRRIKGIVASFAMEFATLDKEFETKWEKVKRWAAFGYRGSAVPLALTADASQVVGLLPKP